MISLLIVLLPLLGLLPVSIAAGRGGRRGVLGGVIIAQMALVAAAFVRFLPGMDLPGSSGRTPIPALADRFFVPIGTLHGGGGGWSLSMLFGIDGFVLPFLFALLIVLVAFYISLFIRNVWSRQVCALFLFLDFCAAGAFISHDGLSLLLCVGGILFGSVIAVNVQSKSDKKDRADKPDGEELYKEDLYMEERVDLPLASRRFLPVASIITLAIASVLIGVGLKSNGADSKRDQGSHTFELPALASQAVGDFATKRAVEPYQAQTAGENSSDKLFFFLLLGSSAVLLMIFPLHPAVRGLIDSVHPSFSSFLLLLFPLLGLYLLFRLPILLFPGLALGAFQQSIMEGAGGLTAIYGAGVALGERNPMRIVRAVVMAWSGVAFLLFASLDSVWVRGAIAALLLCGLSVGGLSLFFDRISRTIGNEHLGDVRGLYRTAPRWSRLFCGPIALAALLPILLCGMVLLWMPEAGSNPAATPGPNRLSEGWIISGILGGVGAAAAVLRMGFRLLGGTWPVSLDSVRPADLSRKAFYGGLIAFFLVIIPALLIAFHFTGFAGETIQRILEQTIIVAT